MLLSWCDSRVPQRRAAFQALRKGALLFYWMLPQPDGSRNPAWDAIDYTGPLGENKGAPPKPLDPIEIDRDTDLECDVVIVGSGAGGGTTAGVLAAAGLDVVVLEAGDYYDDEDFDGSELHGPDQHVHGRAVGLGGPERRAARGRLPGRRHGDQLLDLLPHARRRARGVGRPRRAGVHRGGVHGEPRRGLRAPGREPRALRPVGARPRDARGLPGPGLAHRRDAAQRARLRPGRDLRLLRPRLPAGRQAVGDQDLAARRRGRGRADGDQDPRQAGDRAGRRGARGGGRHDRRPPRDRALAGGGGGLRRHPDARAAEALGPRQPQHRPPSQAPPGHGDLGAVRRAGASPWEGTMQALYSDQHRDLHDGYGLKYETAADAPAPGARLLPVARRGRPLRPDGRAAATPAAWAILLRDRDGGEVRVGRDGEPVVRYGAVGLRPRAHAHRGRRRGADPGGGGRTADLQLAVEVGVLRPGREGRPRRLHGRGRRLRLGPGPDADGLVPHHGQRADGRLAEHLGLHARRRDLGRAQPLRVRRLGVPDRLGREPDDLDRVDRPHERARDRLRSRWPNPGLSGR